MKFIDCLASASELNAATFVDILERAYADSDSDRLSSE